MSNMRNNSEGYSDPTAYAALSMIEKDEQQLRKLKRILSDICAISGFHMKGQVTFINSRTGKIYRL